MKYKFVGEGMGVPGLPHEISDDEAIEMGVTELLNAAIENGSYVQMAESDQQSAIPQGGATSDQPKTKKSKAKNEAEMPMNNDENWLNESKEE